MGLFRKEKEVTPLGVVLTLLGLGITWLSLPRVFSEISFIKDADFCSGMVTILGGIFFMVGIKLILAGVGTLTKQRWGSVLGVFELTVLLGLLLYGLYLSLGDPLSLVILVCIVLVALLIRWNKHVWMPGFKGLKSWKGPKRK